MLGGLWPLAGGRILKPGGGGGSDGLSHDIFYVPQRPYVNTGTLQEQLIYPTALAGACLAHPAKPYGIAFPPLPSAATCVPQRSSHLSQLSAEQRNEGGGLS